MEYKIGDIIQTRKTHPCGDNKWEIIRVGVDFKLKCLGCGHVITVEREKALKMIKLKMLIKTPWNKLIQNIKANSIPIV